MRLPRFLRGAMPLLCFGLAFSATRCWGVSAANDPAGDTFGAPHVAHDVSRIDAMTYQDAMRVLLDFYDAVEPPSAFASQSVAGFIDLDVDQDSSTGAQSNQGRLSPNGDFGLGVEFYVDLFGERFHAGQVEVIDAITVETLGMATVAYDARRMTIDVPLDLIGRPRAVNFGVIVGDFLDMSDEAGPAALVIVPEPGGAALGGLAVLVFASRTRRRR